MAQYETVHELKIHRQPFEDLLSGIKTCEVRRCDDRNFSVGDLVWLRELRHGFGNPWSGRELRKRITHIQKDYGLPEHLCIMSYAPSEDDRALGDEPVLIQAVAVTRDSEDGMYLDWLLEGGISELEFAGTVLFAMLEANDMCDEDGSAEVYLQPQRPVVLPERMDVPEADCPERINAQGWNACLDEIASLNPGLRKS